MQSTLGLFHDEVRGHLRRSTRAAEPELIAPIVDIANGQARLDRHQRDKQPDWTFDDTPSGKMPADRLDDHRAHIAL